MKAPLRENRPQAGHCSACGRPSIRLLAPPLICFDMPNARKHACAGTAHYEPTNGGAYFEIVEIHDDHIICLAAEANAKDRYCYRCWDGHIWPSIHPNVLNMPPELVYNTRHPWQAPAWVSQGREASRPSEQTKEQPK